MKYLLAKLLLLIAISVFGQERELHIPIKQNGDTIPWYDMQMKFVSILGLEPLQSTSSHLAFRIWTDKQVIEINEYPGHLSGRIISWAIEYSFEKQSTIGPVRFTIDTLPEVQTSLAKNLIKSSDIRKVPDERSIPNWLQGYDGVTYYIEDADSSSYSFKSYWEPETQGSLVEALLVDSLIKKLCRVVEAKSYWTKFEDVLPFVCYQSAGPFVTCSRKMLNYGTRRQWRKTKRKSKREKADN
ncbi:MAG: hypothetical protein GC178_00480 [Flavobacteriales bacterium]|nr:hypothetical protein [Flavobacteriales bacterium]